MAESNTGLDAVVQMKTNANTSYLFTDQNGTLQMYGDTGKTVAFMNSNNVGIGNTNPNTFLCVGPNGGVNQSTNLPGISMTSVSGQNMHYSVGQGTAGTNSIFMSWAHNATAASAYGFISCYGGNNPIALQHSGGNVGIGITNPSQRLHVNGAINCTSFLVNGVAVATGTGSVWGVSGSSAYYTSGNVGIGIATPGAPLHIYSATADYKDSLIVNTLWPSIRLGSSSVTGRDWIILNGGSGAGIGIGNFGIFDNTAGAYRFSINSSGNVSIPGTLSKGGGTFDIQHPLSSTATKRLVHSFIEGPRCDLIYRGKKTLVNGVAIVDINKECTQLPGCGMADGTFEALCANAECFLQNKSGFGRVIGSISGGNLTIAAENSNCNDTIVWMVIAERADPFIKEWDRTDPNGYLITEYTKEIEVNT